MARKQQSTQQSLAARATALVLLGIATQTSCHAPTMLVTATPVQTSREIPDPIDPSSAPTLDLERLLVEDLARGSRRSRELPTQLWLDAQPVGAGQLRRPIPYYGQIRLVAHTAGRDAAADQYLERRILLRTSPPLTGWLFPLDFFADMAVAVFGPDVSYPVELSLPKAPDTTTTGYAPSDAAALRDRAAFARTER